MYVGFAQYFTVCDFAHLPKQATEEELRKKVEEKTSYINAV